MTQAELVSARHGHRLPRVNSQDLIAALALGDVEVASVLVDANPGLLDTGNNGPGVLHVMAKRGDAAAVKWLLDRGADPNAMWGHWDAKLPPVHLAAAQGHADVVRLLLARGADPSIRDSKHDGDAIGWAEYGSNPQTPNWREIEEIIRAHGAKP
jgi:ankyrin repeat protein